MNCIFALDGLHWGPSHEIDHLELFAGDCSVTRGEFQDQGTYRISCLSPPTVLLLFPRDWKNFGWNSWEVVQVSLHATFCFGETFQTLVTCRTDLFGFWNRFVGRSQKQTYGVPRKVSYWRGYGLLPEKEGRTRSIALDVTHDPSSMDLLSPLGFVSACYHATCIRPGGGLLAAPVCSSFVYMPLGYRVEIEVFCSGVLKKWIRKHFFCVGLYNALYVWLCILWSPQMVHEIKSIKDDWRDTVDWKILIKGVNPGNFVQPGLWSLDASVASLTFHTLSNPCQSWTIYSTDSSFSQHLLLIECI